MNEFEPDPITQAQYTQKVFHPTESANSDEILAPVTTPEAPIDRRNELPEYAKKNISENVRVVKITKPDNQPRAELLAPDEALARLTKKGTPDASLAKEGAIDVQNLDQGKFAVLFGRDSLKIIKFLRKFHPELARRTVLKLAEFQSAETDPAADKLPGGIIHELRLEDDPIAEMLSKTRGWKLPYYGSADSTLMFISAVAAEADADVDFLDTPITRYDDGETVTMRESLNNALEWLATNRDKDKEFGFVTYQRQNPGGIENQILRDSPDSMSDRSGRLANHDRPIASLQAQADAYDALIDAAELFEKEANRTNDASYAERAAGYREQAQILHDNVIEQFWIEDERGGFFAVGLDQDKHGDYQPLDTRTNDMAYVLSSKLLTGENDRPYVEKLVATLQSDEMKVGSGGLRSLSKLEKRFHPAAYHNGSDWLVADAEYAEGLYQHGYIEEAIATYQWIIEACETTKAYPEYLIGGESDTPEVNNLKVETSSSPTSDKSDNTLMQPPEMGQGWSIAAYILAKQRLAELLVADTATEAGDEDEMVA